MNDDETIPETLADIVREMREMKCHTYADVAMHADFCGYADRIEAAEVRERGRTIYAGRNGEMTLDECITRCDNNSGDNPRGRDVAQIGGWLRELRERKRAPGNAAALRSALAKFLDLSRRGLAFFTPYRYTEAENAEIEAPFDEAKSALAAPARNCDQFATFDEAQAEFDRTHEVLKFSYYELHKWLFAPMKENGNGGNK